jgi:hypothetical protein
MKFSTFAIASVAVAASAVQGFSTPKFGLTRMVRFHGTVHVFGRFLWEAEAGRGVFLSIFYQGIFLCAKERMVHCIM